ncbi:hypothetical protein QL679_000261 [Campylobacter coli]|nr:hypothetical protein [Campylobacter coli]EIY9889755.1 hypothetical protein [Campylobacter coli]EKA0751967.1 hypothetical protein [Campylobacter coli]ELN2429394.1 hypothetical protein [Campylobacter coli]ELW6629856.1 hypothetical protein [Campylobacter coli]
MIWKKEDLIDILKSDGSVYKNYENNSYFFDLQKEIKLECIVLKLNNKTNIVNIEYSKDNLIFYSFDSELCKIKDNAMIFILSEKISVRYLRICIKKEELNQINLYIRKFPLLFVAARGDAFGSRIMALLNAIWLSKKFRCKFGFVWNALFHIKQDDNVQHKTVMPSLPLEEEVFESIFIKKYSYTKLLKSHPGSIFQYKAANKMSIDRLLEKPYSHDFGWYVAGGFIDIYLDGLQDGKYLTGLRNAWREIQFLPDFNDSIQKGIDEAGKLGEFVSIHIRCADMCYSDFRFIMLRNYKYRHIVTVEMALAIIDYELNRQNVLICGDDLALLDSLKKHYSNQPRKFKLYSMNDFVNKYTFKTNIEQILFELYFRSKSSLIYSTKSTFGILPYLVSESSRLNHIYDFCSKNDYYKYIKSNIGKIVVHDYQLAASYFVLFIMGIEIEVDINELYIYIRKSLSHDKLNITYQLFLFFTLLRKGKNYQAEKYICFLFKKYPKSIFSFIQKEPLNIYKNIITEIMSLQEKKYNFSFLFASAVYSHHKDYENSLLCYNKIIGNIELETFSYLVANLLENLHVIRNEDEKCKFLDRIYNSLSKANCATQFNQPQSKLSFQAHHGTAKSRIQNQLSYKLGQAMIVNSKSLLGYIRMPFVLSYIKDKHKQEQKIYQEKIKKDPSLKLPPLENYPDYKEALKEKECLTYKLGEALIKANKTWYKGGYVKLLFKIRKLKIKKRKLNE